MPKWVSRRDGVSLRPPKEGEALPGKVASVRQPAGHTFERITQKGAIIK